MRRLQLIAASAKFVTDCICVFYKEQNSLCSYFLSYTSASAFSIASKTAALVSASVLGFTSSGI